MIGASPRTSHHVPTNHHANRFSPPRRLSPLRSRILYSARDTGTFIHTYMHDSEPLPDVEMTQLPDSPQKWDRVWALAASECTGNDSCQGWRIFKMASSQNANSQHSFCAHAVGMLIADLTVTHHGCIGCSLRTPTLVAEAQAGVQKLLGNITSAHGALRRATSGLQVLSADATRRDKCACGRRYCAGGRRCQYVAHASAVAGQRADACSCGREKCRGGRRCPDTVSAVAEALRGLQRADACSSCGREKCQGGRRCNPRPQQAVDKRAALNQTRSSLEAVLALTQPCVSPTWTEIFKQQNLRRSIFITGMAGVPSRCAAFPHECAALP